jgi:pSer/pThr/pTyr-binding forkhead associated (FHA) protein
MRDGRTIVVPGGGGGLKEPSPLRRQSASLVVLTGPRAGESFPLDKPRIIVGRGPGVDLTLDDPAMSRQHMAVEIRDGRFQVRDLDSTNGLMLNGRIITAGELKHRDRLKAGDHELEFIVEERRQRPHTYVLPG